jgi:membrane protein implicated in regulation of membrane protease activity
MTAQWLLSWWNLIFTVPFFLALVYLGVYTLTGWSFGDDFDADHDLEVDHDVAIEHDVDVDHDIDVDHDVDVDHDADLEADADADADHDADHDAEHDVQGGDGGPSPITELMLWLGVGRVPVGLVLMVLLFTWGIVGFITNNVLRPVMPRDWMVAFVSLPLALFGSAMATRTVTGLIAKYMPLTETSAKRHEALLGQVGEAMYAIDHTFGMASVRDKTAGVMQVPCRVGSDYEMIAKGSSVLLVSYDASDKMYTVIPYELGGDDVRHRALAAGNVNGKARHI